MDWAVSMGWRIRLWVCGGFADHWSNLFERRLNFGENLTVIFNRLFMRKEEFCAPFAADFADIAEKYMAFCTKFYV